MSSRDSLEKVLPTILDQLGVRAVQFDGRSVRIGAFRDVYQIRLAMPADRIDVEIEALTAKSPERCLELMYLELERGQRTLFRHTFEHMAKHDRTPLDRVKSLEDAAKKLLEAMGALDEIRMPYGHGSKVGNAAAELAGLLKRKPGQVTWSRNDPYGLVGKLDPDPEAK